MTQEIDKKRLMYLDKLLTRERDHWTSRMLSHLCSYNTGWAKNIIGKLGEYNLESDWEIIRTKTKSQWKNSVDKAIEKNNEIN